MADVFYDTAAAGLNDGTSRANAYTTLAAAITGAGAGGRIFGSHLSTETIASATTLTSPGSSGNRIKLISVNFSLGTDPAIPLSAHITAGCTFQTSGNNALTINGYGVAKKFKFYAGSGAVSASMFINSNVTGDWLFDGCDIGPAGTSGGVITMGASTVNGISAKVKFKDTTATFAAVTQSITVNSAWFDWENTPTAILGSVPTDLIKMGHAGVVLLNGVDVSALGAGKNLVNGQQGKLISFNGCKMDAAVSVANTLSSSAGPEIVISDCTIPDQKYDYRGYWKKNTTYSMLDGSNDGTAYSYELTTTANAKLDDPFESLPLVIQNSTVGSAITVTIEGIWSDAGSALPQNDDFFIKAAYFGTTGSKQLSFASSGQADLLAAATNLNASSVTWNASPATPVKFKTSLTFTPQVAGNIMVWVCGAAGSVRTAYFNAQIIKS